MQIEPRVNRFAGTLGMTGSQLLFVAVASLAVLALPLLRYLALHSAFYDLGQYLTNLRIAASGFPEIAFRSHAQPISLLLAPAFDILPPAIYLLVEQSVLLILGALTVMLLARRLVPDACAWAPLLLYFLSAPLWSSTLFDYHFEHVFILSYLLLFLGLEKYQGPTRILIVYASVAVLCMTKETYALSAAFVGLYLLASRKMLISGAVIAVLSTAYFFVATQYVIPANSGGLQTGSIWSGAFGYLGATPSEMLASLVLKPQLAIAEILSPRKLVFLVALLGPALFALRYAPLALLPALPQAGILLLSRDPSHTNLAFQYAVPVWTPLLVASFYAFARLPTSIGLPIKSYAVTTTLAVSLLFGVIPGGRLFFSPHAWSFNYSAYLPAAQDRAIEQALSTEIPADRTVAVAFQNNLNTSLLSDRLFAFAFPFGVFEPVPTLAATVKRQDGVLPPQGDAVWVDYVVLDLDRPWYIADEMCPRTEPELGCSDPQFSKRFNDMVTKLDRQFDLVRSVDGLRIYRRRPLTPID